MWKILKIAKNDIFKLAQILIIIEYRKEETKTIELNF